MTCVSYLGIIAIFGAMSMTELGAFLINSNGISSDLGLGILGDPSLDLPRFADLSLDFVSLLPSSFLKLVTLLGLFESLCLNDSSALCNTPGGLSFLGAAMPGPRERLKRYLSRQHRNIGRL